MNEKPILIVTVGLPRSGKSTWARTQNAPIVCPDSVRIGLHGQAFIREAEPMVWAIVKVMIPALFQSGHDRVILDATSVTRKTRDGWFNDKWDTRFMVFTTPKEVCVERAIADKRQDLVSVIERMSGYYEPLDPDEQKLNYVDWEGDVGLNYPPRSGYPIY
jgi:predicted kinase